MTEKEDSVYKAKLAEQAERYDGTMCGIILFSIIPNDTDTCLCVIYSVDLKTGPQSLSHLNRFTHLAMVYQRSGGLV